jgi:hypothetical protein
VAFNRRLNRKGIFNSRTIQWAVKKELNVAIKAEFLPWQRFTIDPLENAVGCRWRVILREQLWYAQRKNKQRQKKKGYSSHIFSP